MAKPVLKLQHVSVVRGGVPILKNMTWKVQPGESWAVIGPNGSGKTTLLNMISGNTWSTDGDIQVLGRDFGEFDLRELRRHIGWVSAATLEKVHPDDTALSVAVSGKFASFGLYEEPDDDDWDQAVTYMHAVGLKGLEQHLYATLSQGEKQKVLICRALMTRPQLLVLDEPCAGLDIKAREQLLETIQQLGTRRKNPPAFILATHHVEEIAPVISHVLFLKHGHIAGAGMKDHMLSSKRLSELFDLPVELRRNGDRYNVRLAKNSG